MSQPIIVSFRPEAAAFCLDGRKRQTRRLGLGKTIIPDECGTTAIYDSSGRMVWRVGSSVAIKPKRTAKAIGRVMVTGLRVERVQDITEEDARLEGVTVLPLQDEKDPSAWWQFEPGGESYRSARDAYRAIWKRLCPSGPNSWEANPLVVVIEFRPLAEGEK